MFLLSMHPFAFLLFYVAVSIISIMIMRWRMSLVERRNGETRPDLSNDPYTIALLRHSAKEAVAVAILALCDRGLLRHNGTNIEIANPDARMLVTHSLERAIVGAVGGSSNVRQITTNPSVMNATRQIEQHLQQAGLLSGAQQRSTRMSMATVTAAIVLGLGALRIVNALIEGRHNIGFLLMLMLANVIFIARYVVRRRTGLGDAALEDLQTLFSGLRGRASSLAAGTSNAEMMLLAGIFGLSVLSPTSYPLARELMPQPSSSAGSSCGSSGSDGGSSCSSSSCGGGSGCGG